MSADDRAPLDARHVPAQGGQVPARIRTAIAIAAATIAVGGGIVVALNALATRPPSTRGISMPAIGAVEAAFLADGRPIFVVRHRDGRVSVLDAFSTHVPTVYKLVAWCPEARLFSDLVHGSTYDEWGVAIGGPAPTSMTVLSWAGVSQQALQVTGTIGPAGPRKARELQVDWASCHFIAHRFDSAQALTPAQAVALPKGTWVLVGGSIDVLSRRMCGIGDGCPAPALVDVPGLAQNLGNDRAFWASDRRLWLAETTGQALAHLTVVAASDQ
ncbi:MAG: hypothetical protein ABI978_00015 [Chloroflexota bacterium]